MRIARWLSGAPGSFVVATSGAAYASEGAASYYFAGGFGSFLVAVPPEPGLTVASQALMLGGRRSASNATHFFTLREGEDGPVSPIGGIWRALTWP